MITFRPLLRPHRVVLSGVAVTLLLLCGACTSSGTPEAPTASLASTPVAEPTIEPVSTERPLRIVSLGGGVTETLWGLGLGEFLVGVDSSSQWPESIAELPRVGYHRRVSAEGVLALSPTHLVVTPEAGPRAVLEQIRAAGVTVIDAGDATTIDGAYERIDRLAAAFGRETVADEIEATIRSELASIPTGVREASPKVLFVYARGPGMILVAGRETGPGALVEAAGARNAGAAFETFVPLTAEAVVAADPDVLLFPEEGLASLGGVEGLATVPGIAQSRAWQQGAVATVDDTLLLAFGPRTGQAVASVERAIASRLASAESP